MDKRVISIGGIVMISSEVRRLQAKWQTRNAWPKWLEWLEIKKIRGWSGQRIDFDFPIVAIVGGKWFREE